MIAFDLIEQMHAEAFNLIRASARQRLRAHDGKIALDKRIPEGPHSKIGMTCDLKECLAIQCERRRGVKPVRAPRQKSQLLGRARKITRLAK